MKQIKFIGIIVNVLVATVSLLFAFKSPVHDYVYYGLLFTAFALYGRATVQALTELYIYLIQRFIFKTIQVKAEQFAFEETEELERPNFGMIDGTIRSFDSIEIFYDDENLNFTLGQEKNTSKGASKVTNITHDTYRNSILIMYQNGIVETYGGNRTFIAEQKEPFKPKVTL